MVEKIKVFISLLIKVTKRIILLTVLLLYSLFCQFINDLHLLIYGDLFIRMYGRKKCLKKRQKTPFPVFS